MNTIFGKHRHPVTGQVEWVPTVLKWFVIAFFATDALAILGMTIAVIVKEFK